MRSPDRRPAHTILVTALLLASLMGSILVVNIRPAGAQETAPLHPAFPLLDEQGENVLDSGGPVSPMRSCAGCHDTAFIAKHSFHADVGLGALTSPGEAGTGREWDTSPGLFGRWDPLIYRYLSAPGDALIDLTTAEWVALVGARHVGGGPAIADRTGAPLTDLEPDVENVEAAILSPETGELSPWDWQASGVAEMNCFLCHTASPNNQARIETLAARSFGWAATATLADSGVVAFEDGRWSWNRDAFDDQGNLNLEQTPIQGPTNENCGQCHGLVHADIEVPLTLDLCTPESWSTVTTGQIFSPQHIAQSGLNIAGKSEIARSWDVHAERVLQCTDCHYALNNPIYYQDSDGTQPEHLTFDPRRIDLDEYLLRPLHQFAKGDSAQSTLAPEFDHTVRDCEGCHSIENSHDWLPYKERHITALACESCHIPKLYAPARQSIDWTVLQPDGSPVFECRGVVEAGESSSTTLISGFEPTLMPTEEADGSVALTPYNLLTSWFWVYGDPARPVRLLELEAAWLDEAGDYPAEILAAFDGDGDGQLSSSELVIDSTEKESLIAARLAALGLEDLRIAGEVAPYGIHHNVAEGEWVTRECAACHSNVSRLTEPFLLAGRIPGDVQPEFVSNGSIHLQGELVQEPDGALYYQPVTNMRNSEESVAGLYVLGHDNVSWVDWFGVLLLLATFAGVIIHGGMRFVSSRSFPRTEEPDLQEVYMYTMYERLWHWLQTLVIFGLLFTGLIIHKPDMFGVFSFRYVVEVHNVLALILIINAALAAFYHVASGEIRQYIPRPRGFFFVAFAQMKYYLRGIFRNEPHPMQKTPERKLNPLQQITYFGLLNVLLPLQIITGALMWGLQRWPEAATLVGGLPFLAPFHTLISWLLASFIVMHVYLTTTGHTATANIRAMMMGWDEVETHPAQTTEASQ